MKTKTRTTAGAIYDNHNPARIVVSPNANPWLGWAPKKIVVVMTNVANPWR